MDKIIARNLKKLREAAHYTQDEVASAIGITHSAYSNYESGDREVPYDVIEKASDFFVAAASRIDGLSSEDAKEIRNFNDVVKCYYTQIFKNSDRQYPAILEE